MVRPIYIYIYVLIIITFNSLKFKQNTGKKGNEFLLSRC